VDPIEVAQAQRQSNSDRGKVVNKSQEAASTHAGMPNLGDAVVSLGNAPVEEHVIIKRAGDIGAELAERRLRLGKGSFMTPMFHEPEHDSACILIEPRCTLKEVNKHGCDIVFIVVETEHQQLEFRLSRPAGSKVATGSHMVSNGAELLVPAGIGYSIQNRSRSQSARIIAVVPRST